MQRGDLTILSDACEELSEDAIASQQVRSGKANGRRRTASFGLELRIGPDQRRHVYRPIDSDRRLWSSRFNEPRGAAHWISYSNANDWNEPRQESPF